MSEPLRHPFKYRDHKERILQNVVVTDAGCWEWQLRRDRLGYGYVHAKPRSEGVKGRVVKSHRLAYEAFVGPIPEGLVLDHLCRNPPCCNPAHLEAVTQGVNTLRSPVNFAALNSAKTHCKNGHEFTEENTYLYRGGRTCRACNRQHQRNRQARIRAGSGAVQ